MPKTEEDPHFDPMEGWSEGVSLRKSHFGLLLKPQVILKTDTKGDEACVLAAMQATLQSFAIIDKEHTEDPISGKVMSRYERIGDIA